MKTMSNHELSEDPSDLRHNTPPMAPNDFGLPNNVTPAPWQHEPSEDENWAQQNAEAREEIREQLAPDYFVPVPPRQMPSRIPGQGLIHPHVAEHGVPAFGTGLSWQASAQSGIRVDLVNFPWGQGRVGLVLGQPTVSNIELRTIYAHLIETATAVRAEMRERGMQVDL